MANRAGVIKKAKRLALLRELIVKRGFLYGVLPAYRDAVKAEAAQLELDAVTDSTLYRDVGEVAKERRADAEADAVSLLEQARGILHEGGLDIPPNHFAALANTIIRLQGLEGIAVQARDHGEIAVILRGNAPQMQERLREILDERTDEHRDSGAGAGDAFQS